MQVSLLGVLLCSDDDEASLLFRARAETGVEVEGEALLLLFDAKVRLEVKELFTPFEEGVFEVVVDEERMLLPLLEALIEVADDEASLRMEVLNVEVFFFSSEVF